MTIVVGSGFQRSFTDTLKIYCLMSILNFRGIETNDSEFIDINVGDFAVESWLRKVFYESGFANHYNNSDLKLLPCPLGTFVNISDTSSRCIDCPAGKLR